MEMFQTSFFFNKGVVFRKHFGQTLDQAQLWGNHQYNLCSARRKDAKTQVCLFFCMYFHSHITFNYYRLKKKIADYCQSSVKKIIGFRGLHFRDLIEHFAFKSLWQQCFPQHPIFWTLSMWTELRLPSMTVMREQLPFSSWLWHGAAIRRSMPWLAPGQCATFLLLQGLQTNLAGGLISCIQPGSLRSWRECMHCIFGHEM